MKTQSVLRLATLSCSVLARRREECYESVSDVCDNTRSEVRECFETKEVISITERIFAKEADCKPCNTFQTPSCDLSLPINCFSTTCAYKFTELSYLTIKDLVLPKFDLFRPLDCGLKFYKNKECNVECEVYKLLLHVINTVSPAVFDEYYTAFYSGNYFKCFLILQRTFSPEAEVERIIVEHIIRKNRDCRRKVVTSICFVDPCTRECSVLDLPGCNVEKRVCLYLPRHCVRFEDFICLPFGVDDAIITELDFFVSCGFKRFYFELVKKYFKNFRTMSFEKRILWWLRIKFFVFNCVGYCISHLSTGAKSQVLELLIKTAKSENDAFYLAYARSLGIINK